MKKIGFILLILILSLLTACSDRNQTIDNENKSDSTDQGQAHQIKINDAMGEQTIKGTPKKIVVLEWSYAEDLLALGVQPAGVADLDGYHKWVNVDKDFADSVKDVGTRQEPNLEAISRLNPDLIIAVKFRHEQILDSLKEIAPVVTFAPYSEEASKNQFQSMKDEFNLVAKITDKESEAKDVLADLDKYIGEQNERVADAGLGGSEYLAAQAYSAQNTPVIRLFTDTSMVGQLMNGLGFKNAYQTDKIETYGYSEVTLEALQNFESKDLQFLYIVQKEDNIFENQFKGNPVWENLTFVKKGNTHPLPGDTWTFGGPLSAKVLTKQLADGMVKE